MLIIAIPKSCSTSLLKTLGRLHGLPADQIEIPSDHSPGDYRLLSEIHYDQAELDDSLVCLLTSDCRFYKQHILPTANNRRRLQGLPTVVLLRQPDQIVLSYRRAVKAGMAQCAEKGPGRVHALMHGCRTEAEWLRRAREIGLLGELERFYTGWVEAEGERLIVHYDDLLQRPGAAVNRIEDYFALPHSVDVSLSRDRYSRSAWQNLRRRAKRTPVVGRITSQLIRIARASMH